MTHDQSRKLTDERAAREAVAKCVEIARRVGEDFLSPEYAMPQPVGSVQERFAVNQVVDAIMHEFAMSSNEQRILVGRPTHAEEYRASLAAHLPTTPMDTEKSNAV